MEGRRIEGVFLDSSILRNKAYEAYETAKVYEIRILSRVPEALLASLGEPGSRFRAVVRGLEQGKVSLMLENGYEVVAENRLSIPVKTGDELSLVLESKNPLTLRVERSFSGLRGAQELIKAVANVLWTPPAQGSVREVVENSGISYERKVWDFLRGVLNEESLNSDLKFQTLRSLERADTQRIEAFLRDYPLPPGLKERVGRLLELSGANNKLTFFKELTSFEREVEHQVVVKQQQLREIQETVRQVVKNFLTTLMQRAENIGVRFSILNETLAKMELNPRTVGIMREALKSLEEGRVSEFLRKMELVGVKADSPEPVVQHRDKLTLLMRDLVRGADTALSSKMKTEDIQLLARRIKEVSQEIESLSEFRKGLTESLPRDVKENLSRLETISYMQAFFVAQEGRKFVVPFRVQEGKGIIAFSLENVFRVFIKLSFEEGFLGILIEAPKKAEPDNVSVLFKTDIRELEEEIRRSIVQLDRELSALGLEVRRLEVINEKEESFDREVSSELGEKGVFNLRV